MDKTFDATEAEARIYAAWEEAGAFRAGANARPGAEAFSIMIPPPNVTGVLHVGHAFNNTLQDVLIRWHRMRGFDTLWQPGTDHAGIATQMVVERELAKEGKSRRDMSREEFLSHVWAWKAQSGGTIRQQLKRLGASCDWSREAFTMSGAPGAPDGEEGQFPRRRHQGLRRHVRQGLHLPRQAAGELGPAFRDRDLGPRGREHRRPGQHVALQVPLGGRRNLYVFGER
jgi:valyl-tRNA synthetase